MAMLRKIGWRNFHMIRSDVWISARDHLMIVTFYIDGFYNMSEVIEEE